MINSLPLIWISSLIVFCHILLMITFPFSNLFLLIPLIPFLMISLPMNLLPFLLLHLIVSLKLGNHHPTCMTIFITLFLPLIVLLTTLFLRFLCYNHLPSSYRAFVHPISSNIEPTCYTEAAMILKW